MVNKSTLLSLFLISTAFVILLISIHPIIPEYRTTMSGQIEFITPIPQPTQRISATPSLVPQKPLLADADLKKEIEKWTDYQLDKSDDHQWMDGFCNDYYFSVLNKGSILQKTVAEQLVFLTPNYFKWTDTNIQNFNQHPEKFICAIGGIMPVKAFSNHIVWVNYPPCGALSSDRSDPIFNKCVNVHQQINNLYGLYQCPSSSWVNCMPSTDQTTRPQCQPDFLDWASKNCPNFQGAAL